MTDDERRELLMQRAFLTPAEAAFLLRRDKSTVTRWIQRGLTQYVKADEVRRWAADPDRRTRRKTDPQ